MKSESTSKLLTARAAKKLIANMQPYPELRDALHKDEAFVAPDGTAIVRMDRTWIWLNAAAVRESFEPRPRACSILHEYDIASTFVARRDEYRSALSARIGFSIGFSPAQARALEKRVARRKRRWLEVSWFEPLLSYAVEHCERSVRGTTRMARLLGDWYPLVTADNGHTWFDPALELFRALDDEYSFALPYHAAVRANPARARELEVELGWDLGALPRDEAT